MKKTLLSALLLLLIVGCSTPQEPKDFRNQIVYELNTRQFTPEGTFRAAEEHLERLKAQGIDIIWVMPLYPIGQKERKGTLGSYYAVKDYCNTNPEFGTLEDFDHFVKKAHDAGLSVIIDWVPNHTSPDHPWTTEKPADWYLRDENGKPVVQYDWTDIAPLNYDNQEMRSAMLDCMRFWLGHGIDGYRCDVAHQVPQDFWENTISTLRKEAGRPLFFLAEGEGNWFHQAGFDASYSWKLHHLVNDVAKGKAGADDIAGYVKWNADNIPGAARLTFSSNHDENSWAGTEFERMGDGMEALSILYWTLPQSQPLVYTAQEIGYDHRFQFFEKDPVPAELWSDEDHNAKYHDFYLYLSELKKTHPALNFDSGYEILSTENNVLSFSRFSGEDTLFISVQCESPWKWTIKEYNPKRIERIEPPCWWVGMKTDLQLLVKGNGISEYDVKIKGEGGVKVKKVHKAESPNYLFVDISIPSKAKAGTYELQFSKGDDLFYVPYEIRQRVEGSAQREGFSTKDLIYLIMPDRFSNGDPSNDNVSGMNEQCDNEAFFGRHGGDLQGIINHLDYIAGLGVTAIWLNPALEDNELKESYHGYACTDYYNIDPRIGGNVKYKEFVDEAHKRGIKVIMDIVTNHCGDRHWWMSDLPFSDWIHAWPEYTHSNCAFSLQNDPYSAAIDRENMQNGWFDTTMVDMNLDNPFLLQYFKQWGIWWTEWADLDGFRIDTYPYNEKYPMAEWNEAILAEYPNYNIVGEVWSENLPQVAYWQADNPNKDGFNSNLPTVMDFRLQSAICGALNVDKEDWENGITKVYNIIADDVYLNDVSHLMIFSSNHDQDRVADIFGKDVRKAKIMMTLVATLRGIPQIYTGDEILQVSRDRSQGHGGLRVEFNDKWNEDPSARELHDYCSDLFNWRKGSKAVQEGKTLHFISRQNTYAYFRYTDENAVFVFVNNNDQPKLIPWHSYSEFTSSRNGVWVEALTGKQINPLSFFVPAKGVVVFQNGF